MAATPGLQPHRAGPAQGRLADFWRWWRGELVRMLPERFSAFGGAGGTPLVMVEGDEVVVIDPHAPPGNEKRASVAGLDDLRRRAIVRSQLEAVGETRGRARAALRHEEALSRRVTLPAATEENLPQVLAFEMDRLSPFKSEEVYFDQRVVSRDAATGQITVELAMARRETVDARVRELDALGISVQGVALREDSHRSPDAFDLLPPELRGERETARERLVRSLLLAAVALLFIGVLAYPVYNKREAVKALAPTLEKARQDAQATDAVVRELERQVADYNYLLGRRHSAYPVGAYVEEISRLLPDNTWLQQLDIKTAGKAKELVITGETASSSRLIELLEQSKMMQNAGPRGPTTRGSVPNVERFMIGAELKPRTPPEAQPVAAVGKAPQQSPQPQSLQPQSAPPSGPATAVVQPLPKPAPSLPVGESAAPPPQGANAVQTPPSRPNGGFGGTPRSQ